MRSPKRREEVLPTVITKYNEERRSRGGETVDTNTSANAMNKKDVVEFFGI
jgi:hypothetical protein